MTTTEHPFDRVERIARTLSPAAQETLTADDVTHTVQSLRPHYSDDDVRCALIERVIARRESPLGRIKLLVAATNNGKLLLANIPYPTRDAVPALVKRGFLNRATFLEPGDAVTVADR